VWSHLRDFASEPTGLALDGQILAALPVEYAPSRTGRSGRQWALAACVATLILTVAITGAVAGFAVPGGGSAAGGFAVAGRTWTYRSTFHGEVTFKDASGSPVGGEARLLERPAGEGGLVVAINGKSFVFSEAGEHELRDGAGNLLGIAVMRPIAPPEWIQLTHDFLSKYGFQREPQTAAEMEAFERKVSQQEWDEWGTMEEGGGCVKASRLGVYGYDDESQTFWKVRGVARVTVLGPDGEVHDIGATQLGRKPDAEQPEIVASRGGIPTTWHGYGRYEVRDERGDLQVVLVVERAQRGE
jgi:hypothetical protein